MQDLAITTNITGPCFIVAKGKKTEVPELIVNQSFYSSSTFAFSSFLT